MIISKIYIKKYQKSEYQYFDYLDTDTMFAYLDHDGYEDMSLCFDLMFYCDLYDINGKIEESYAMVSTSAQSN